MIAISGVKKQGVSNTYKTAWKIFVALHFFDFTTKSKHALHSIYFKENLVSHIRKMIGTRTELHLMVGTLNQQKNSNYLTCPLFLLFNILDSTVNKWTTALKI